MQGLMKILITGGAGCLGSNLIEHYLPQGHEICVIENFATGKREVLPHHPSITVVEGSIADRDLVQKTFDDFRPTHVIHSAAAYKDPNDWEEDTRTNVIGSINVAKSSAELKVKRVVNLQTSLCYGNPDVLPIPVSHPLRPLSSYAISKTAGEGYLLQSGLNVVSFRLASVIAPRLVVGALPTFYQRLKAGKACFCSDTTRDFMDIEDFFDLVDKALLDDGPQGCYNASTGEGHTIKEIFDLVVEYLGIKLSEQPPIIPPGSDDVSAVVLDPTKTYIDFAWKPAINFRESIYKMLTWYDKYGVSEVYSHVKSSSDNA